jgi:uncharacterized protein
MDNLALVLVATFVSLFVSSIAGYGGSLILVPTLGACLGPKEGIALAALLLGWNNIFKVIAYRRTLSIRPHWPLLILTAICVWIGARALITVSDRFVTYAIATAVAISLVLEIAQSRTAQNKHQRTESPLRPFGRWPYSRRSLAAPCLGASGVLSGISGVSGPLKGIGVRYLGLSRLQHVGFASMVSLIADLTKVGEFAGSGLLDSIDGRVLIGSLPVMPIAAYAGKWVNERIGEGAFRWIFWTVVGGYTLRMFGVWF